ncbi:hypothetical protein BB560_004509, partial [Smittium megazygosporum]
MYIERCPFCNKNTPETIKHMLIECFRWNSIRHETIIFNIPRLYRTVTIDQSTNNQALNQVIMSENRENKSRTRSLEPEIFTNDESVEPFRWIRRYELYSKKEGWDESKQLELLELFLDGKALNWFEQKVDSFKTWKDAKEAFLSKFDSHETELRSWRELQTLKQNKEEDLEEFILKIEKLFERSNIRDSTIKFKCLLSSVLPKYQKLIIKEKIKSYDEALTTSLEQEAVEKICRMDVIEKETESQGFNIQVNELKHTVKNSEN